MSPNHRHRYICMYICIKRNSCNVADVTLMMLCINITLLPFRVWRIRCQCRDQIFDCQCKVSNMHRINHECISIYCVSLVNLLSLVRVQLKYTIRTQHKSLLASHLVIVFQNYACISLILISGATVTSLAYSANGRHLCAGLESGAIQVFNLSSKAQQFALETQTVNYFINILNTLSFLIFY